MTKTYLQLAREIASLQAAAEKQLIVEKKEAVARLNEVIAKYDLSAADLKFPGARAASATSGAKAKPAGRSATAVAKYADGTGNTWGGRGPRPAWLREAIAAGKSLESFEQAAATGVRPAIPKRSATASPAKRAGLTVAPKYRHAGTGETWSGRGSAPRWLKEALRKRGTKVDDFLIAKPGAASSGSTAEAAKSGAVKSGTVSRRKSAASARSSRKPAASARKAIVRKPAQALTPAPAAAPKKKPEATKQAAAVPKRTATKATAPSTRPARKAVAAKKTSAAKSAKGADLGAPSSVAPGRLSSAAETSTVV